MNLLSPLATKTAILTGAVASAIALSSTSAVAATLTYDFDVAIDSGDLFGETFSGSFSFDDLSVTGSDEEFIAVDSLSFDYLGVEYTEADGFAEAVFFDGDFLGLEFAAADFSFIPGLFDLSEAFFAYDGDEIGGAGDIDYTLRTGDPVKTPEPAGLLAIAMIGGAMACRARTAR